MTQKILFFKPFDRRKLLLQAKIDRLMKSPKYVKQLRTLSETVRVAHELPVFTRLLAEHAARVSSRR